MKALLDTNILIHREGRVAVREDIGLLFHWIDELGYSKWIHPDSVDEINKHIDEAVKRTLGVKLGSYKVIKVPASDTPAIEELRIDDKTTNDTVDTNLLAEVAAGRMAVLLTEDRGIHRKAESIGIRQRVFTIESFLEKALAENPALVEYPILSVQKVAFGALDLNDEFFDSFKADYKGFSDWFEGKSQEDAYVSFLDGGSIAAFLYIKLEGQDEDYRDISPEFAPARRLKIGTFKVVANGFRLGERLLKIVFDYALAARVDQIYVTLFKHTSDHERLASLLEDWGFKHVGWKATQKQDEYVLVREFNPHVAAEPQKSFPFIDGNADKYLVAIYPLYHTELLPDSILRTENTDNFVDNEGHRNALRKVFISRSWEKGLRPGDVMVFYRTAEGGPAYHTSVVTTIGIVQRVHLDIPDLDTFLDICRKRSVFSDDELAKHWNYRPTKPFVVDFLYTYSFPRKPNLRELIKIGAIANVESAPRGFLQINNDQFNAIVEATGANRHLIVD